ncbi:MAG: alpha/beta hydrolase [Gordonia sp. (in: high G+C Gram-positive bacteria)]|uniref:alpha/beta fold hydrolase n=1 Tax=Gordonia sp. (in: high G+C Gram-positive bacteria) TaxID=84139 RepID=UPI0039E5AE25
MRVLRREGRNPDLAVRVHRADDHLPPVLLVHGMGGDHSTWRTVAGALDGRTVFAVDLRGHGVSQHARQYRLDDFADDLGFVLDGLGTERVDVVAHSLGAHASLRFAMGAPDRVRRMVLEEPPPMPRDAADVAEEIRPAADLPERLRGLRALAVNPQPYLRFDRVLPDAVNAQFRQADPGWWEALAAVESPTVVVSGGERSFLPTRHLRSLAEALPRGEFTVVDSGHSVHRDRPREFNAVVAGHLAP